MKTFATKRRPTQVAPLRRSFVAAGRHSDPKVAAQRIQIQQILHGRREVTGDLFVQRQATDETTREEGDEVADSLLEGARTLLDQLEPVVSCVKEQVLDTAQEFAEARWEELTTSEQVALGAGVGTMVGTLGAGLLSSEMGRERLGEWLEDADLAAPLQSIPYMPLSEFRYRRDEGTGEYPYELTVGLSTANFMDELRTNYPDMPPLDVDVTLKFGFSPGSDDFALTEGNVDVKLFEGIGASLSVGGPSDVTLMLTLDLVEMDWSRFSDQTREFFRQFR